MTAIIDALERAGEGSAFGLFYAERMGKEGEPYIAERGVFTSLSEFLPYRQRGWEAAREVNNAADAALRARQQ